MKKTAVSNNYGWRRYQQNLNKSKRINFIFRRILFISGAGFVCFVLCIGAFFAFEAGYLFFTGTSGAPEASIERTKLKPADIKTTADIKVTDVLPKKNYRDCLSDISINKFLTDEQVNVSFEDDAFLIATSLYPDLQNEITKLLAKSLTSHAAAVVIDAFDGKVYALSEYKKEDDSEKHLGLKADFPAASLFKIITAAAALEVTGLSHDSELFYDGGQYTLYKKQLKQAKSKWSDKIIFGHAFAQSVNPVFGKIGIYEVGKNTLFNYACAFLFNNEIPFDFPVDTSFCELPDDEFAVAEIASGFNKRTKISPLHAAMLSSAVVNGGYLIKPRLIDTVSDREGKKLEESNTVILGSVMKMQTASELSKFMEDTVKIGTCRNTLKKLTRKRTFSNISVGAKTGSINSSDGTIRYDWVTCYAVDKNNKSGICVAVLAGHGEKIGIRASELARIIIDKYYLINNS